MSLIVHSLVENTIYANGAILTFFVKDDMMPDLVSQKTVLDDVICFFEEYRYVVQTLDGGVNLSIIDNGLILRPGFDRIVPNAVQIGNGFSG